MEVHHHSHSSRKKWTHYFWEFLMLFLAVFCGFLAEYQLEHKIEKDREKKFMRLLAQDLQSDIDSIARIKIYRAVKHEQADSLRSSLVNQSYKKNGANVYYWGRDISRRRYFLSADGTMQQLKNSGNLRLIRNQDLAQKIIAYDVTYRSYLRQLDVESDLVTHYRTYAARVFDAGVFQLLSIANIAYKPEGNPQLFDSSPAAINELVNQVNYLMGSQFRLTQILDEMSDKATELLLLIKKEYRLK